MMPPGLPQGRANPVWKRLPTLFQQQAEQRIHTHVSKLSDMNRVLLHLKVI